MLVDTSAEWVSVGVFENGISLYENYRSAERRYNSIIIEMMQEAFEKTGLKPFDIKGYGAVMGPGNFTGVRVGIAVTKAMCRATGSVFYGASSLEIIAESAGIKGELTAILDAKRQEAYFAVYEVSEKNIKETVPPDIALKDEILESLYKDKKKIFCGIERDRKVFGEIPGIIFAPTISLKAFASVIGKGKSRLGLYDSTPIYIRKPDAVVKGR